ncbi:claudin-10-like isoform X1 [Salarias fasciatus]|uniref:claudin-10-like isoform X1 n=1 Tax=Salarias fasciatus TaxID=181472 RepID=UPI001176C7AD|nr:claudin-10-like isoform X1 [Salarias fasciatus]
MWTGPAQIVGLLLYIVDWGLVGCTLGMDRWRVAQPGGRGGSSVVATAWYWSDLWRDCYEDSTAVVNCVDFGVLWTVKRGLRPGSQGSPADRPRPRLGGNRAHILRYGLHPNRRGRKNEARDSISGVCFPAGWLRFGHGCLLFIHKYSGRGDFTQQSRSVGTELRAGTTPVRGPGGERPRPAGMWNSMRGRAQRQAAKQERRPEDRRVREAGRGRKKMESHFVQDGFSCGCLTFRAASVISTLTRRFWSKRISIKQDSCFFILLMICP